MSDSDSRLPPHVQALSDMLQQHADDPVLGDLHRGLQAISQHLPGYSSLIFQPPQTDPQEVAMRIVVKPPTGTDTVSCPVPGCNGWRPK